ncbi:Hypothetical protein CINCED_3A012685 [Cinara cedri]|uniref:Reverse transcriptase domain n=1 Tax=Cinara cedri TaxID=506608 RepID=A0A5E4M9Q4_9HEMI|nr:Hypothetical protein CINCED_3A012685 [Cinara cedri]
MGEMCAHRIIHKKGQPSIYGRPYREPFSQQGEINTQIQKMLDDDIIKPSMSPWNAPLLLVKKKADALISEHFTK